MRCPLMAWVVLACALIAVPACSQHNGTVSQVLPQTPSFNGESEQLRATDVSQAATATAGPIYFGAFVNPNSPSPGPSCTAPPAGLTTQECQTEALESLIGRRFALHMHYRSFLGPLVTADELADWSFGRIPVESWNCYIGKNTQGLPAGGASNFDIAGGKYDAQISAAATAIAAYHRPMFIRYLWEMNLPKSSNGRSACNDTLGGDPSPDGAYFDPGAFERAWNHVVTLFAAAGATNVTFVWNPNADVNNGSTVGHALSGYFPGPNPSSNIAEIAGIDVYDKAGQPATFWQNASGPQYTFATLYRELNSATGGSHGKPWPILIGETGESLSPTNGSSGAANQVSFLPNAGAELPSYPNVIGFMYFDALGTVADYTLFGSDDPRSSQIGAFRTLGAAAYFGRAAVAVCATPPPRTTPLTAIPDAPPGTGKCRL